jgi:hypothetical protein
VVDDQQDGHQRGHAPGSRRLTAPRSGTPAVYARAGRQPFSLSLCVLPSECSPM